MSYVDTSQDINTVEWFFGYGGNHLGLKRVLPNLRLLAACEIEEFAIENILAKMEAGHLEAAPIWSDCKTFPWEPFVDRTHLFVASYPCQPFSAAGKRQGADDERHLWPYVHRWILRARPLLVFLENVEGHISLGLSTVISDLEEGGYKTTWGVFSAAEVGAPHQRKRVFILAHRNGERGLIPDQWRLAAEQVPVGYGETWGNGRELVNAELHGRQDWQHDNSGPQLGGGHSVAWPSRPGEQQFAWEPPRVVLGNASNARHTGQARSSSECSQGQSLGHAAESDGAMGHPNSPRPQERPRQQRAGIQGVDADGGEAAERQTQPPLGRDADGPAGGLGYADLCESCANRTDELRLLGNGVVPATAERAFRVLVGELMEHQP